MDWQSAFNLVLGVLWIVLGWALRTLWDANRDLAKDLAAFHQSMPETYVRRDDFRDTIKTLFEKLDRIEGKLDGKADKP